MGDCELEAANGHPGVPCEEAECMYWRLVSHLDIAGGVREGCAIQYFGLLGDRGGEIARWLLSAKERVERQESAER